MTCTKRELHLQSTADCLVDATVENSFCDSLQLKVREAFLQVGINTKGKTMLVKLRKMPLHGVQ